jgi:hypothetical protein
MLPTKFLFHTRQGPLTRSKILRHGAESYTPPAPPPPNDVVLRIFITLKNPSPSAGFEPSNLRFNGQHGNH